MGSRLAPTSPADCIGLLRATGGRRGLQPPYAACSGFIALAALLVPGPDRQYNERHYDN